MATPRKSKPKKPALIRPKVGDLWRTSICDYIVLAIDSRGASILSRRVKMLRCGGGARIRTTKIKWGLFLRNYGARRVGGVFTW